MSLIYKPPKELNFIQSRAAVDFNTIDEYAEMMREGVVFEPAQGLQDEDGMIWIWDGFHRAEAAKKLGRGLSVYIEKGDRLAAEWRALTANQKHGLRRSNADKQRVIELALKHPKGASLSDSQIAKHCGVSDKTVARVRRELELTSEIPKSEIRTGADGRQINTANIGHRESGPNYAPVSRLIGEVRSYLIGRGLTSLEQRIVHLYEITDRTPAGKEAYSRLLEGAPLTKPFRPGDVWAACQELLEQSRQQKRAENPTTREIRQHTEWLIERGELPPDYDAEETRLEAIAQIEQAQSEQFTCPTCRQRTVKFNGKTLCLNPSCGATWPTRDDYLRELDNQAEARGLTIDFSDMSNEDIERDLASLEAGGYGDAEAAIRMRAEIAARRSQEAPVAEDSDEPVVTFRPEPPQLLDKEHRGRLKAQFAEAVNHLPAEEYARFVERVEDLLGDFGLLRIHLNR